MKKVLFLLFLAGCVSNQPVKVTKLPQELPPSPLDVKPIKRGVVKAAPAVRQITLNIQYPYSEPDPIVFDVWHSTSALSKPGGPTWSIVTSITNGAPNTRVVNFGATNDMEWFQVRGRDPKTGWTGGWATVTQ